MADTGETYQQALSRLRAAKQSRSLEARGVDLLCVDYFGRALTLATFEILETLSCVVMPSSGFPLPLPKSPFFALQGRRTVH